MPLSCVGAFFLFGLVWVLFRKLYFVVVVVVVVVIVFTTFKTNFASGF